MSVKTTLMGAAPDVLGELPPCADDVMQVPLTIATLKKQYNKSDGRSDDVARGMSVNWAGYCIVGSFHLVGCNSASGLKEGDINDSRSGLGFGSEVPPVVSN